MGGEVGRGACKMLRNYCVLVWARGVEKKGCSLGRGYDYTGRMYGGAADSGYRERVTFYEWPTIYIGGKQAVL